MAARKLQTEIDRTLKKVSEGVELFESIYEKMQNANNQTQKEKLEMDLKTQIKKLQRLRDQIKTWAASNDIKDKSALLDNRRLIETQMEKFKACEKEMKTKAFSKEGLIQSAKLDPKAQEKMEITSWVRDQVEELLLQLERSEAEIETLQQSGGKKKSKAGGAAAERLEELERLNERRKWHISRLEIILRLLDNGSMATEKITALKEDVQYFVESNTDEDFDEDEGIYDELNLDEEEEKFGIAAEESSSEESDEGSEVDVPVRTPSKKQEDDSPTLSKRDGSPILRKAAVTLQLRKPSNAADVPRPPNPNFVQQPMASILKAGLPPTAPRPPQLPPIRYAAAAAAAVSTPTLPSTPAPTQPTAPSIAQPIPTPPAPSIPVVAPSPSASQDFMSSSPSLTHPSVTSPMLSSASASAQQLDESSLYSRHSSPSLSESISASVSGPAVSSSPQLSLNPSVSSPHIGSQSPHSIQLLAAEPSKASTTSNTNGNSPAPPTPAEVQASAPSPLPQQIQQYSQPPVAPISTSSSPLPASAMPVTTPATAQQPQFPPGVIKQQPTTIEQQQQQAPSQGVPTLLAPQQPQQVQQMQAVGSQRPPSTTQQFQAQLQQQQQPPQQPLRTSLPTNSFPGSLSDLVVSFENVKQKAVHRMSNLDQVHKLLEGGYSSMPQPQDTEKPKYYVPRNQFPSPAYYPQTPNPVLSTSGLFSQLDVETLFYVFYYHPGTYLQYLAAKELKRQSWRFHVKYLTWFQRHSEPQAITEEYEQGVYVYFDWEGSWCQRKKSDFRFEYRYLSED